MKTISPYLWAVFILSALAFGSCKDQIEEEKPEEVLTPRQLDSLVSEELAEVFRNDFSKDDKNRWNLLFSKALLQTFYEKDGYKPVWTKGESTEPLADSLILFINKARYYGLFPDQYHFSELLNLRERFRNDSIIRNNLLARTRFDIFSTDAFFHILCDLKEGRLIPDSLSILNKKNIADSFFSVKLNDALQRQSLTEIFNSVEPVFFKYHELRAALPAFVDSMDPVKYPQILYPFEDSLKFVEEVYTRLTQKGFGIDSIILPDTATLARAVKKYQKQSNLEADGKIGPATIKALNHSDEQKFRSIALSLDKFKMLPSMPETFVWVNIPSFGLQVFVNDTNVLESKIIVGKPATPTPELTSAINNLVVYPNWTIPASIIRKEILPALKKNPDYLSQKGYNLFDEKGEIINPYGVNWARYSTGIPWRVVQGSGDDNALGVFKFNFNNPYSVYLHDTNQRYLFANTDRALSHGCVRVQKWQQLADIIALRDSSMTPTVVKNYSADSIKNWVSNGTRKSVNVRNRFPLYIVYYTSEAKDGRIQFYSDIYNEDSRLFSELFENKKSKEGLDF